MCTRECSRYHKLQNKQGHNATKIKCIHILTANTTVIFRPHPPTHTTYEHILDKKGLLVTTGTSRPEVCSFCMLHVTIYICNHTKPDPCTPTLLKMSIIVNRNNTFSRILHMRKLVNFRCI